MRLRHFFIYCTLIISSPLYAGTLDVSLSDSMVRAVVGASLGPQASAGRAAYEMGFLYNEDDNMVALLGLQMIDEASSTAPGLEGGVGVRFYVADGDNYEATAVALGGQIRYHLPPVKRLALEGQLHYAPRIVSFIDADGFMEIEARISYEILPDAAVYLGYRNIEIKAETGPDITVEEGGSIGIRFLF